jgi:peptidoglycan/LPS O-acetylase OafA/YrhL
VVVPSDSERFAIDSRLSGFLDVSRWLAALAVVAGHIRALTFVEYGRAVDVGLFDTAFYFLTGLGREAVMVFFVLGGFLVGGNIVRDAGQGEFSWRVYAIRRLSRLYPVLIVALFTGCILDHVGQAFFPSASLYLPADQRPYALHVLTDFDPAARLKWSVLLMNLLMCQTILVPPYGTNGPLWFLAYQFWYYILFPAILIGILGRGTFLKRLPCIAVILFCIGFLPIPIWQSFLVWLLGVLVRCKPRPLIGKQYALLVFVGAVALSRVAIPGSLSVAADVMVGGAFALLLNSQQQRPGNLARSWNAFHKFMAQFSYSLYVFHFPLVVCLVSCVFEFTGVGIQLQPTPLAYCFFLIVLLAAYLYAFLLSRLVERRTPRIRRMLAVAVGAEPTSASHSP